MPSTGLKPISGQEDYSEHRDNGESRERFVQSHGGIKALFASSEHDDEDYFLVPEVLDEP